MMRIIEQAILNVSPILQNYYHGNVATTFSKKLFT